MGKISKRDALRICRKLWLWLAENPGKGKADALRAGLLGAGMACACPCCEYNAQRGLLFGDGNRECGQGCLLKSLWPDGCLSRNSPFALWDKSGNESSEHALRIAEACKEPRHNISGQGV